MKQLISDFFFYNRKQKIGVLIFSVVTIVNVCVLVYDPFSQKVKYDYSALAARIDSAENSIQPEEGPTSVVSEIPEVLHVFDPNSAGLEDLISLGFEKRIAERIINFRSKGGQFRSPEDLMKIYGIRKEFYQTIYPFIVINRADVPGKKFTPEQKKISEPSVIELNSADSTMLCTIKGIGPAFAKRIIKYRQKLGGFLEVAQLREVYGLDSIRFEQIKKAVTIDPSTIRRIQVNLVTEKELSSHPYAGFKLSRKLIAYRTMHGGFKDASDLEKIESVSPSELERLKPYLQVQ